jgi:diguanylate cyclase (GGDEF)-like protein/PAS domain S-box-containing protein
VFSVLSFGSLLTLGAGVATASLLGHLSSVRRMRRSCDQRFERFGHAAQDALWEWWHESGEAHYSARLSELLGVPRTAAGNRREFLLERVHPEDRAGFEAKLGELLQGALERVEHEHRLRHQDGSWLWVEVRVVQSRLEGRTLLTGWVTDISERKSAEHQLRFHAFRDSLTGLANRSLFMDRLTQCLLRDRERESAEQLRAARTAVLLIDLDRFKRVNDSLCHSAGDSLLYAVAERLSACVRDEDTVARLGGDEFALLLNEITSAEDAIDVATRARRALMEPIVVQGRPVTVGASIGIVVVGREHLTAVDVVRDADTAMYRAKAQGRGQWALFDASMRAQAVERMTLENELRSGLSRDEIEVFFQPIVDGAGRFAGVEALPRWHHPRLGKLLPADFIRLAEETGLIMDLGDLVLNQACELGRRISKVASHTNWTVNVNLSPRQLRRDDLTRRVESVLEGTGLDPARLCFEVTEDLILEELPAGASLFTELRAHGVKLCMDDFGTGYSSLSYLHRFRFDFLKIETAFVHGLDAREGGVQIVRSMVNLARNLGVMPIAEGVESQKQWEVLKALGCPRAQGFYFATPLTAAEFMAWIREHFAACA